MPRKFLQIIIFIVVIIFIGVVVYIYKTPRSQLSVLPNASPPSSSQITFPSKNDILMSGQTYNLTWTLDPSVNQVQIFLVSKDLESQGESIATVDKKYNIPNTGTYSYQVPATVKPGQYKIEIENLTSDYFQINTNASSSSCTVDQLSATMDTQGAAGNIYANLKITNVSNNPCNVTLGNYIKAQFTANNITTSNKDTGAVNENYSLMPNASVYSQLHFPNGPQCQSGIKEQNANFTYQTTNINIKFMTADNKDYLTLQACQSEAEQTVIDIWPVSVNPIT